MKTQKELVKTAIGLVKKGWTQGAYARDSEGVQTSDYSPNACSFCVLGSLSRAAIDTQNYQAYGPTVSLFMRFLLKKGWPGMPSRWNDSPTRTQAEVIKTLQEFKETL